MATKRVFTDEDYAALPDDGLRYEVHEGELSVTPSPGVPHQEVSANLGDLLRAHVKAHGLGTLLYAPLDVILSDTTIVQPDLVYVDPTRASIVTRRAIEGAPTLAVEIPSKSSRRSLLGSIDRPRVALAVDVSPRASRVRSAPWI